MTAPSRFAYRAARSDGALEQGVLAAESREAAARALAAQGLWAIELDAARAGADARTRLSASDLALGLRVLATLLESGLPVSKALMAMPELAPVSWNGALPDLARAVREGAALGAALERSALVIAPSASTLSAAHLAGYALAVFAAFTWAVYSLLPARLPAYSSWATGGFCLGAGLLALVAHWLFEAPYRPPGVELAGMAAIGLGPLGLAFVLWDRAMRTGRASTIGSLSYLTPVLSTLALA